MEEEKNRCLGGDGLGHVSMSKYRAIQKQKRNTPFVLLNPLLGLRNTKCSRIYKKTQHSSFHAKVIV